MGRKKVIADITPHLSTIENMAKTGITIAQIARIIGIAPRTFDNYRKEDERIDAALEKGKAVADAAVGKACFTQAIQGNIGAIRWYEMTRCNKAEKQQTEVTEIPYVVALPEDETPESWAEKFGK